MITTYFLKCIAEDIFKHQEMSTIPYEFYIALSSTEPNADSGNITEPSADTGYTRAFLDNSNLTFNLANDDNVVLNHTKIYFPETLTPWENIGYYAIFDSPEDGNLLIYGALEEVITVPIKTIVSIPANTLSISIKNEVA